jgi:hypothetical protein
MSLRRALETAWRGVSSEIGRPELLILTGITLISVGLWPYWGRATLVVPGVIALAIALAPLAVSFRKG